MELKNIIEKIQPEIKNRNDNMEGRPVRAERGAEMKQSTLEKEQPRGDTATLAVPNDVVAMTNAQQQFKDEIRAIELVLEKDLGDIYLNMSPEKQREFRIKGEETARQISILLHKTKIQVKKIVDLVRKWLSVIPGLNKFFLEQEAKIRADNIIKLKRGL